MRGFGLLPYDDARADPFISARVSARSQESCQAREKSLALIMIRFVMQLMSLIGLIAPHTFTSERARELADRTRGWRIG
jgi:hypothetical protein